MSPQEAGSAAAPVLYHDGCRLCLDIARTLGATIPGLVVVDLGQDPGSKPQAVARGVVELPSLVIGAKVLSIAPHSRVDAH